MGSRIACHFSNAGINVLLLDIAPKDLNDAEKAAGLAIDNKKVKNRIVNDALASAIKSNPSPLYKKSDAKLISTGNFDDDMSKIADADWVIEVVVENIDIKKIFSKKYQMYHLYFVVNDTKSIQYQKNINKEIVFKSTRMAIYTIPKLSNLLYVILIIF